MQNIQRELTNACNNNNIDAVTTLLTNEPTFDVHFSNDYLPYLIIGTGNFDLLPVVLAHADKQNKPFNFDELMNCRRLSEANTIKLLECLTTYSQNKITVAVTKTKQEVKPEEKQEVKPTENNTNNKDDVVDSIPLANLDLNPKLDASVIVDNFEEYGIKPATDLHKITLKEIIKSLAI